MDYQQQNYLSSLAISEWQPGAAATLAEVGDDRRQSDATSTTSERRRLQNRLAQRTYRKNRKEKARHVEEQQSRGNGTDNPTTLDPPAQLRCPELAHNQDSVETAQQQAPSATTTETSQLHYPVPVLTYKDYTPQSYASPLPGGQGSWEPGLSKPIYAKGVAHSVAPSPFVPPGTTSSTPHAIFGQPSVGESPVRAADDSTARYLQTQDSKVSKSAVGSSRRFRTGSTRTNSAEPEAQFYTYGSAHTIPGNSAPLQANFSQARSASSSVGPDSPGSDLSTPLLVAIGQGDEQIVSMLLASGADASIPNAYGEQAIHIAAQRGHAKLVHLLLVQGVLVDASDGQGRTALHLACQTGQLDTIKALLAAGVDANRKDEHGWTPLHYAVEQRRMNVVKMLIEHGVDVNAR